MLRHRRAPRQRRTHLKQIRALPKQKVMSEDSPLLNAESFGPEIFQGWPWVPAAFLVTVLAITILTVARRPIESFIGLGTIGVGWVVWWLIPGRRSKYELLEGSAANAAGSKLFPGNTVQG